MLKRTVGVDKQIQPNEQRCNNHVVCSQWWTIYFKAIQKLRELESANALFFEQSFTNVFSPSVMISPLSAHVRVNLQNLTLCMLDNFHALVVVFWLFSKLTFSKKIFQEYWVSNSLDPDQDWCSVGSDMGPNCLQRSRRQVAASKEDFFKKSVLCLK